MNGYMHLDVFIVGIGTYSNHMYTTCTCLHFDFERVHLF